MSERYSGNAPDTRQAQLVGAVTFVILVGAVVIYFFRSDLAPLAEWLSTFLLIEHPDATVAGLVGAFFVEYTYHHRKKAALKIKNGRAE